MISTLLRFSLIQRLMVIALALTVTVMGYWSFKNIPIDAFPDISPPQVQIIIKAPGMAPAEVEQRITVPIEIEMQGVPRQKIMRSTTKYALSIVTLDFNDDVDIYWARQQVNERLTQVLSELPPGVEGGLAPITTPLGEIFMYRLESSKRDNRELRRLQDWVIRPRLRIVEGVADVNSLGGEVETYEVVVQPDKLVKYGISLKDIEESLENNNRNAGGDRINKNGVVYLVKTVGKLESMADIEKISVKTIEGIPVHISDVATVKVSSLTRYGAVTANGEGEVVTGLVLLAKNANSRLTVTKIKQQMEMVKKALPKDVKVITFYDRSELVNAATWTVSSSLVEAIVLVFIVLIFMLGSFRSAVVVSINLPLSVLLTFILMKIFGVSANLMSLGGLAIAIGILIDSAIVIVENIHSQLSMAPEGVSKRHLIFRSVTEVAKPVVSGVAIIIVVFLPLFSMTGLEGKMFKPLAQTIAFAMAGSLFLSLTVVPVLASFLMKGDFKGDGKLLELTKKIYSPVLLFALKYKKLSIGLSIGMLLISLGVTPFIGSEFMPIMDEGSTVVILEKKAGITLEDSLAADEGYHKALMELPEITGVVSRTGADELRLDPMDLYQTDNFIQTIPRKDWKISVKEFQKNIREKLSRFKDIDFAFTMPIDMRVSEMITGVRAAMAIKVFGDNLKVLEEKSIEIENLVKTIPGAVDVFRGEMSGQKYLQIDIKQDIISQYGISVEAINNIIEVSVGGKVVTEIVGESKRTGVLLRYDHKFRSDLKAISSIFIETANGSKVPLSVLATISEQDGPFKISREKGKRQVVVQANVEERDIVSFVKEVQSLIDKKVQLPIGYYVTYGGQFENQQRASDRLAIVLPISLILIFLLLFATFRSIRHSFIILLNIPFALIGGILALLVTGLYLSVPASVGFIALFGIAVMNGVVMVSYFNQLRQNGQSIEDAVKNGAIRRLRPVLMTATITVLGLLPLLLSTGPGSELQRPLSVVVIGGTISSTLLTLVILPTIYELIEKRFSSNVKVV